MAPKIETKFDKVIQIALKRGIFYPSFEIYGSLSGFYDWGTNGFKIKKNWEDFWRSYFLKLSDSYFEVQPTDIMPEPVFRASGHLENFNDPIAVCKKCGNGERADHLVEATLNESFEGLSPKQLHELVVKHKIKCPKCGGEFKEIENQNLMFNMTAGAGAKVFLRPETAQGPYLVFKREFQVQREKLPLGIATIGKAFRNEISPRQAVFRQREFTQAELQIFFDPVNVDEHPDFKSVESHKLRILPAGDTKEKEITAKELAKKIPKFYVYHLVKVDQFYKLMGIHHEKLRFRELSQEERAFYNKVHFDIECWFDSLDAYKEIGGVHYRTDHDLGGHQKISGQNLTITKDGKKILPHVLELSFGVDRNIFALIDLGYKEEGERVWLSLPARVAPFVAGVYPLVNKDKVDEEARKVYEMLREHIDVFWDDGGSIGRRYARADEVGVPFGITFDYDSLKNKDVTIRFRDSTKQSRVPIKDLLNLLVTHVKTEHK